MGPDETEERDPFETYPDTMVGRIRRELQVAEGERRFRSRVIAAKPLTRDERILAAVPTPTHLRRPVTRGDCVGAPRPCPWVSCAAHLYLDADPKTGALKMNFPGIEPGEMVESCSLDAADRGGVTLEEVGRFTNVTRERIRQQEEIILRKIERAGEGVLAMPDQPRDVVGHRDPARGAA